ncbi:MAG TPA: hypothetical protein V6D29_14435 [Leptolyngbyaceae cyanobacterium]
MTLSWQERFRAAFTGLVVADLRAAIRATAPFGEGASPLSCSQADHTQTEETFAGNPALLTWRQVLVQMAQSGHQAPLDRPSQEAIRVIEVRSPIEVCLLALPLMLLNLERPGATALIEWAEQQGLQLETQNLLKAFFQLLCKGMETVQPAYASVSLPKTLDWLAAESFDDPLLALAVKITLQARGQYGLALQLADLASMNSQELLPLVGLLSTLQEGLSGVPLSWRLGYLNGAVTYPTRMRYWAIANEAALWQLADGLFYRWVGLSSSVHQQPELTYPVVQIGTAVHWASGRSSL